MADEHERGALLLDQRLERALGHVRLEVRGRGGHGEHLVDAVERQRSGVRVGVGRHDRHRQATTGRVLDRASGADQLQRDVAQLSPPRLGDDQDPAHPLIRSFTMSAIRAAASDGEPSIISAPSGPFR